MNRNKNRHIAGFNDVANSKDNVNHTDEININNNDNDDTNVDPLDKVINANKKKDNTHVLKGIYFEKEVAQAIDRVSRSGGKGIKSQIVNEAVKKVFKEKGWM